MRNYPDPAARIARDDAQLAAALQRALPSDTLNLDAAGLANLHLRLSGNAWVLVGDGMGLDLGGAAAAHKRIIHRGTTYLLVGANGHASILAAIKAARGGETVLVAPGTYREAQAFVIDRTVTLQGVSEQGAPIVDGRDVAATIIAMHAGQDRAAFTITAPGVMIEGLAFLAEREHTGIHAADTDALVRLFDEAGKLRGIYEDIQAALDAAQAGDRIVAPAGRHVGDLHIRTSVTLAGVNAGRPGGSARRENETTIFGCIVMGRSARSIVIDGLVIWGSFAMEPAVAADRRFALRNCVIDGRDGDTAISVARGAASEIVNNLIRGGDGEAIRIGCGFDELSICGNHIEAAACAVGIAISGGPAPDRLEILGNTFLDGDYGVSFHVDSCLGQHGDAVVLAGNHFGRSMGGTVHSGPIIAAVHADGVMPVALEASLGASLDLNNYHIVPRAAAVDLVFESPEGMPAMRSLASSGMRANRQSKE